MYSYHIFYFPFKWENPKSKLNLFCDQTDLSAIEIDKYSNWVRNPGCLNEQEADELYNEKNYYYQFVHAVLYDTSNEETLLHHYERKELQEKGRKVYYKIATKGKEYVLDVDGININLYSTGVGTLTFYLQNNRDNQKEPDDILKINQFGRRLFPPFIGDLERRSLIANYIEISGLNGDGSRYKEDFSKYVNKKDKTDKTKKSDWEVALFIGNLIHDLAPNLEVTPVIDDRMFVACWYVNDDLSKIVERDFVDFEKAENYWWYRYIFVDEGWPTCQNDNLRNNIIEKSSYLRWQKLGSVFGVSRYSFVSLTNSNDFNTNVISMHIRTLYSRMVELVLVQRASTLRFSKEVTNVSTLPKEKTNMFIKRISSLYEGYIRFVNQVHFREVTTQDQGIELYQLISKTLNIEEYVEDLDKEIGELHQYVSMLEDKTRNKNAQTLNYIAAVFLPMTAFFGLLNANAGRWCIGILETSLIGISLSIVMLGILLIKKNK